MHSRPARVGEQIREELSSIIERELKDPGIGLVTITFVKVSADLQNARVFYTVLGDDAEKRQTARGLDRAAPYVRRQLAARLRLRRAPEVAFTFDESVARGERIEQLLEEIRSSTPAEPATPSTDDSPPGRDTPSD